MVETNYSIKKDKSVLYVERDEQLQNLYREYNRKAEGIREISENSENSKNRSRIVDSLDEVEELENFDVVIMELYSENINEGGYDGAVDETGHDNIAEMLEEDQSLIIYTTDISNEVANKLDFIDNDGTEPIFTTPRYDALEPSDNIDPRVDVYVKGQTQISDLFDRITEIE